MTSLLNFGPIAISLLFTSLSHGLIHLLLTFTSRNLNLFLFSVILNRTVFLITCFLLAESSDTVMPDDNNSWLSSPSISPPPTGFPRKCFICIQVCQTQDLFDKHMEDHKNMPVLTCEVCKQVFLHEKLLVMHKQRIYPNLCNVCTVEMESTSMYIDHMLEFHRDVVDEVSDEEWSEWNRGSLFLCF